MREYLFPIKKLTSKFSTINSKEDLQNFVQERSAHVTQTTLYGYLKTWSKNATLANEAFGESVDYLSVREVIKNLNYFYEDPLNSYIPIPSAIIIANLYGQRVPINVIEKYIQDSRDWVNSLVLDLDTLDYSRLIEEKYFKHQKGN